MLSTIIFTVLNSQNATQLFSLVTSDVSLRLFSDVSVSSGSTFNLSPGTSPKPPLNPTGSTQGPATKAALPLPQPSEVAPGSFQAETHQRNQNPLEERGRFARLHLPGPIHLQGCVTGTDGGRRHEELRLQIKNLYCILEASLKKKKKNFHALNPSKYLHPWDCHQKTMNIIRHRLYASCSSYSIHV